MQRARPLLGTLTQITAEGALPAERLHVLVSEAFESVALVQRLMSWHDPQSELSRINRAALLKVQPLHPHTRAVLTAAVEFARISEGAFDPCVAASLAHWGLLPMPSSTQIPQQGTWRDIEILDSGVRFHRPLWIDLGGIAKGYAVDVAVDCLSRHGIEEILVNAGGDLRVAGPHGQEVLIRHPQHAHLLGHRLHLQNEALATSSAFESRREQGGRAVSALVDPRGPTPFAGMDSLSVRASQCMTADALTKIALFAPTDLSMAVFQRYQASCLRLTS